MDRKATTIGMTLAVLCVALVLFVHKLVLPIFANAFAGLGVELPLPTRIVLSLMQHPYLTFAAVVLAIWLLVRLAMSVFGRNTG